jgi:two-component system sensor histidine kinase/response regulator
MKNEVRFLTERIKELESENFILKQQQIEITEAKELYLKIFEEFPALIWRSRPDKLCDYFNKTWLDFTGRTIEQEFGNGWTEGVHPDDFAGCLETYVAAFDKRESFIMEYRMKNKCGEYCWIRDFGRPFYDFDDTFLGYIGSCYDITQNKNSELKLIELNATKDKFFSIIAHDLKHPFNSILGFSEHLIDKIHDKDYAQIGEFASIIRQSSDKAVGLLMSLMEWAQSQSNRIEFRPEKFDMNTIVKEVVLLLKGSAEQKSILINNTLSPGIMVNADKAMISTVLRNLISNAIKFTQPKGEISIASLVNQDELTISITDNGVGISLERINKLFKIGEGYPTKGTEKESGTGLGLILCKEFIDKNNGKIWAESIDGTGTKFSFSLPIGREKTDPV